MVVAIDSLSIRVSSYPVEVAVSNHEIAEKRQARVDGMKERLERHRIRRGGIPVTSFGEAMKTGEASPVCGIN
uniref:Uncharacterized protein n=1 Tax=Utricularia reniformis TaxID=192314 RepID=A0A1Y0B2U8_9LAMI|nr:hypothetical protein AEK19_MT1488 [Utricularia reniformis]ART31679.1 hypothetical protein AEK19_MT1488 [Utricularia reniformis]